MRRHGDTASETKKKQRLNGIVIHHGNTLMAFFSRVFFFFFFSLLLTDLKSRRVQNMQFTQLNQFKFIDDDEEHKTNETLHEFQFIIGHLFISKIKSMQILDVTLILLPTSKIAGKKSSSKRLVIKSETSILVAISIPI